MPSSPSTVTISHLKPPGPSILSLPTSVLSSLATPQSNISPDPPKDIPELFLSALHVRIPVFVTEQHCSLANEIDTDDARSWHWIAFDGTLPVATLRLVPVSGKPSNDGGGEEGSEQPVMEKEHLGVANGGEVEGDGKLTEPRHGATGMWDGREGYIKIGRMATLSSHRGMGIAQRLIEEALVWTTSHATDLSSSGDGVGKRESKAELKWEGLVLSHAQKSVQRWWTKMGFEVDEGLGEWWEEGIEHVGMWRRVRIVG
ncbi:MAG: hypothetical protein Q9182_004445 [Xanthomendoza sp. 2 TL-2023]